MKKRIWTGLLALVMAASLVACGGDKKGESIESIAETVESETKVVETEPPVIKGEYKMGETWAMDGQWAMVITGVELTDDRNWYCDLYPNFVYNIDYYYTNDGFDDGTGEGLLLTIDEHIKDSEGEEGIIYPGNLKSEPKATPVGAACKAQACVGVAHMGKFELNLKGSVGGRQYDVTFVVDPDHIPTNITLPIPDQSNAETGLLIGEKWTVDDQWDFMITGVEKTDERLYYMEQEPAAVYIIDYTYKNYGYEGEEIGELYFDIKDCIIDAGGTLAYDYPVGTIYTAESIPVGVTCTAQTAIAVDHAGDFRIILAKTDSNGVSHKQTFTVNVK